MAAVVLGAAPAAAHAELESASPAPGASVPQAPAVVLRFTEALNPSLSTIDVTGPAGDAARGPGVVTGRGARVMRRQLGILRLGRYLVRWTSVSADDGHTLQGSYQFAIAAVTTADQRSGAGAVSAEGALGLVGQLLVFVGLVLWAGACVLRRRAQHAGVPVVRIERLRAAGPGLAVVGSVVVVAASFAERSSSGLLAGRAGVSHLIVLVIAAVGVVSLRRPWGYATAATVAVAAEVAAGHVAVGSPLVGGVLVAAHLLAVGVWLFAIAAALVSTRPVATLGRLSPFAIGAAALVGVTGVATASLELRSAAQLVSSGYGRTVLAKLVVFVLLAGAGTWQWRRRVGGAGARSVLAPLRLEATFAVAALVIAAVLSATGPPAPALSPGAPSAVTSPLAGLAGHDPVSLAQPAGPYVVALTVTSPRPEPLEARVQVVGPGSLDQVAGVRIAGSLNALVRFDSPFVAAGDGIFDGRMPIRQRGTWTFIVSFTSATGRTALTFVIELPARSGATELARALRAETGLRSAQLSETLRSSTDSAAINADYSFQAPDAISFATAGAQEVDIGTRSFQRSGPIAPWSEQTSSAAFRWPHPYFRDVWEPANAPRIVGTGVIDGVSSRIIAFVRPDLPAWFRIWVGARDGLIRREEMLAASHLMTHVYGSFNAGPPIGAPR